MESRQKKGLLDGTICGSESLEGGKCGFKGIPENFYWEVDLHSVSLSASHRSEKSLGTEVPMRKASLWRNKWQILCQ